MANFVG